MADPDGTRERILDAARRCVVTQGLTALSTRTIAEAAQVPVSQLHYRPVAADGAAAAARLLAEML